MKLRNAAPQWQSLPRDSYSRYWEINDKHNNSRKAFRNAFRFAIWLWVLKRVSKEENTAKVRSDTRLSQKHVSVEMINAKLFWNAFTMCLYLSGTANKLRWRDILLQVRLWLVDT